ncbi:alpha/beta fold hydrolase [Paracoccus shanxieyensis]|uniref:Alpha/beta fold hydrolase n=1 Tax=Paracoccus shanxieyensis TaxID=2675752 RepID=A0A6L6IWG4_9RHOB|nr:alpha/beta hydrolase [Paracoccus shanxieyensis]MTH63390.1 alpha/beta fold hydrolase [Paracoccus shanxieyensis]MTH86311.1 alpha/beta fold hydrolase [Paracoccus shanxieyensis]
MKAVSAGCLEIHYHEVGPEHGDPVIMLHGFPYDAHAYDAVSADLAGRGFRCLVPYLRGYGPTRFLSSETMRSGQQAALGADLLAFMDALGIKRALLGGYDWGGRAACIVAALWPERVRGLVSCGQGYNIQDIANARQPAPPVKEARYWYMYYFHTERGRFGLTQNRHDLCRYIWSLWSPSWRFDDATWAATALSFENPDFVEIVLHSYRHRFGGISGDPSYDEIEERLSAQPDISVPCIVLQGRDDGVDPPVEQDSDRAHYTGFYERRIIDGAGHNLPQEAPEAFAAAMVKLAGAQ